MPEIDSPANFLKWFRYSSPYINAHQSKTFVLLFDGEAVQGEFFASFIHDIALLNRLGIRLILVHGARPQIEHRLKQDKIESQVINGIRITDEVTLRCVKESVGCVRMEIEAMLSMGVANSPMAGAKIRVVGGNYVMSKPLGIHDGTDYCFTGEVRRIDTEAINDQLNEGAIVLLSSIGYSPTGEIFSLTAEEVATRAAIAMNADKFIYLTNHKPILDDKQHLVRQMTLSEAKKQLNENSYALDSSTLNDLTCAVEVCGRGIRRAHLIDFATEGALLLELFTRNGIGTLVTADSYDTIRQAKIDDVGGVLELIEPLEKDGILVRRSRERLETEIDHFTVMERDGMIVACAALYPFENEKVAELACLAVHKDYQNENRGETLLSLIEKQAAGLNAKQIFVLTARATHWFIEKGFKNSAIEDLPVEKKLLYNFQRRSKVLTKEIGK